MNANGKGSIVSIAFIPGSRSQSSQKSLATELLRKSTDRTGASHPPTQRWTPILRIVREASRQLFSRSMYLMESSR
jgi:hypothetical protein